MEILNKSDIELPNRFENVKESRYRDIIQM